MPFRAVLLDLRQFPQPFCLALTANQVSDAAGITTVGAGMNLLAIGTIVRVGQFFQIYTSLRYCLEFGHN